jgi:hypothetical protein
LLNFFTKALTFNKLLHGSFKKLCPETLVSEASKDKEMNMSSQKISALRERILKILLYEIMKDGVIEEVEKQLLNKIFPLLRVSRERFQEIRKEIAAEINACADSGGLDPHSFLNNIEQEVICCYPREDADLILDKIKALVNEVYPENKETPVSEPVSSAQEEDPEPTPAVAPVAPEELNQEQEEPLQKAEKLIHPGKADPLKEYRATPRTFGIWNFCFLFLEQWGTYAAALFFIVLSIALSYGIGDYYYDWSYFADKTSLKQVKGVVTKCNWFMNVGASDESDGVDYYITDYSYQLNGQTFSGYSFSSMKRTPNAPVNLYYKPEQPGLSKITNGYFSELGMVSTQIHILGFFAFCIFLYSLYCTFKFRSVYVWGEAVMAKFTRFTVHSGEYSNSYELFFSFNKGDCFKQKVSERKDLLQGRKYLALIHPTKRSFGFLVERNPLEIDLDSEADWDYTSGTKALIISLKFLGIYFVGLVFVNLIFF